MAAYTGLTDISIPLHTISGRRLTLPMSISFHASGRMANEINGVLGMRWTLNCGGLVTRTVKGFPDEWSNLSPYVVNPSNEPSFDDLYSACPDGRTPGSGKPFYNSEFDIFSYALPNGKQGHFILKSQNGVKVPMLIPYAPIKIEVVPSANNYGLLDRIEITDVDGTKYHFGKLAVATENAIESIPEWDHNTPIHGSIPTAWYLTSIVSNDVTDTISLTYYSRYENMETAAQHAKIFDRRRSSSVIYVPEECEHDPYLCDMMSRLGPMYYWEQSPNFEMEMVTNTRYVPTLNGVQFNGGSVSFNYINDFLDEIIIKRDAIPYKKIKFNLTNTGDVLYHLDSLTFYGEDQNIINEKYSFGYYEGISGLDPNAKKDWWGNFSMYVNNLLPYQPAEPVSYFSNWGGNKDVGFVDVQRAGDADSKVRGMLKTITYPTGGQTEFVYEGNRYNYGDAAGLRIAEIKSNPVFGKTIHKTYKYGINENGYGYINEYLRPGSNSRKELSVVESNAMHYWEYTALIGGDHPFPWIMYEQMGFRMRDYLSDPYITFDFEGSQVKYDAVTEYVMEDGYPKQKTQSLYSWGDNAQLIDFIVHDQNEPIYYPRKFSDPQNACLKPVMTGKTTYKYSNNQFEPVRKETYGYGFLEKDEAWDMPVYAHTSVAWARSGSDGGDHYNTMKNYHNTDCSVYGYGYRKYKSGSQVLYNTTIEEFTPAGTIVTQKNMDYEDFNHLLRSEEVTNSKNEVVKTTYSYPKDFESISPYNEMVNRNIINPIIEQVQVNTSLNKEVARTKTNYNLWQSNTLIQPATIQRSIYGNALETEAAINEYDIKGNILQVTGKDGVVTAYVWGYDQKYPVAKIIGSSYADAISQSGVDLAIVNNATLSDATIRAELHKLRTLANCFVSTYTYKPMTGMTSETDPDGRTIYYEYDLFGRLSLTRDKDNNILKKYAYDYQGQCTTCGAMSSANWQATGNTRAKPCEANTAFYGPYRQREEKDMNPVSPTYNQSRWIDFLTYNEALYERNEQYWVNTSTPPRCIQVGGQNTGEQEQEQVYLDPNPCHNYNNAIRWKNAGTNTNSCPLPPVYSSSDLSGNYYSSLCSSPAEPDPIYVPVPAGMFTSTISVADADQQASQYAQQYADDHGTCTVPPITLNFINNAGGGFTITLTDVNTGQEYSLQSMNGSNAYLQNLPQGTYHIYISPSETDEIYYEVGCNYFTSGAGDLYLDDITINSTCNTITAN
ncbi:hypothetical protein A4R26_32585 [Niastella populi]|uniref:DUF5977 domain-containing protein n=2 Tax=Niastella populi TaxID=550983 RepID=A0A1V9GAZ2_9BACT|nr:hypothetical protein A4R26_32585 [Niastella populi]